MHGSVQLDLSPGEWVEVRSESEILATLDNNASVEGLMFMPEMLRYCGQRFQVYKRADRTCDAVSAATGFLRRMERTVHLTMARCDGSAHGGCQAGCLIFWKEAWLRRVSDGEDQRLLTPPRATNSPTCLAQRDRAWLEATARHAESSDAQPRYRCQATELNKATYRLPGWEPTQYIRDVRGNHVPLLHVIRSMAVGIYSNLSQRLLGRPFPYVFGSLKRTPSESLNLQPGEWVVVKTKDEILKTLDGRGRNRGLTFEAEMLPYCGKRFRVLSRVERIIEEASGRMIQLSDAVILEEVICAARYRRYCSRASFMYWREIWLRRVDAEFLGKDFASSRDCALEQHSRDQISEEL